MARFNVIKKAGVTKLALNEKLKTQINSIELQMKKADKKTRNRLASQRDALSAQQSEVSADYARQVTEMDALLASLPSQ